MNLRGRSAIPAITRALDASFDSRIMLPSDMPQLGTEADDEHVVTVRIGTPITIGRTFFVWISRRAIYMPGQWFDQRYWTRIDARGAPIPSSGRFGWLDPWSREVWRREPAE